MNSRPLYFYSCVWGRFFTEQYVSAVLPSFLSPGNFGASVGRPDDKYIIYTTQADADTIRSSPEWSKLQSLIRTEVRYFDQGLNTPNGEKITCWEANKLVNRNYAQVIPESIQANAAIMMLTPDQPWSNGSFKKIREILDTGKRAVSLNCMMIQADSYIPEFRAGHYDTVNSMINISSRDMVRLALKHPHVYHTCFDVQSPLFANFSASTYWWNVEGEGQIMYIIGGDAKAIVHTDPTIPWPEAPGFEVLEHVYSLGITDDDFYWAQESDEMFTIALDSRRHGDKDFGLNALQFHQPISPLRDAWWVWKHVSKIKQRLLSMPMRMNYVDRTETWALVEARCQNYMNQIFAGIELFEKCPELAADQERQIGALDAARNQKVLWTDFVTDLYESTKTCKDEFFIHEVMAHEHGLRGDFERARPHLNALIDADVARAVESVRYTALVLWQTSRVVEAGCYLTFCEEMLRARMTQAAAIAS